MGRHALAEHVVSCREQVRSGQATCRELAERLGVSERAVQACVYGHTYSDLPGALKSPKRTRQRRRSDRLSAEEVMQIRAEYAEGRSTVREIADRHGISSSYVVRLGRGTARTDLPGGTRDRRPARPNGGAASVRRGEKHPNARLDALCVIGIRALARKGVQYATIADIFDTTPENICMIARMHRWRHVPDIPLTPTALKHLPPLAAELLTEGSLSRAS
jgi:transposase-like protein